MTLAFEDADSKLVEVVNVANVDAEKRKFGQDFQAEIWSRL